VPAIAALALLIFPLSYPRAASFDTPIVDVTAAAGTGRTTVAECAIACDPLRGRIILAGHTDGAPDDLSMHVFRSVDGGAHWALTRLSRNYDHLVLSRGDPSVAIDEAGTVYVAYACVSLGNPYAIVCARSLDGGEVFQPPTYVIREDVFPVADKPYLTVGRGPTGEPLVFVTFTRTVGPDAPGIYLSISRDRGVTFGRPVLIHAASAASYGLTASGPGGEIYVSFLAPGLKEYEVLLARSTDGGHSFEPTVRLASTGMGFRHGIPAAPHRGIGAVPSLAVDTSPSHPGRVYVSYVTANRVDRFDTEVVCRWADPAPSLAEYRWSEAIPVHRRDTGSNFHPWLAIDPETGNLAVLSHNTRSDPDRRRVETWLSVSDDGGNRWAERRISEVTTDVTNLFGMSPPDYLEYIGVALGGGVVHCAWAGAPDATPTNTLHYLYRGASFSDVVAGRIRNVPGDFDTPAAALAGSLAGDHIFLDGASGPWPGPIDLAWHVTLESAPGPRAVIDAGGAPHAVRLQGSPFGAVLRNIAVTGFSDAGLLLEGAPAESVPDSVSVGRAAEVRVVLNLQDVLIAGGPVGVRATGVPVQVEACRFSGLERALDLTLRDAAEARDTRVTRSVFTSLSDDPASVAVHIEASDGSPRIERNTIHGYGTGIRLSAREPESGPTSFRPLVTGNLVTGFLERALETVEAPNVTLEPAITCNNFWSPLRGVEPVGAGSRWGAGPDQNLSTDPWYCGAPEDPEGLSLQIDSPVSAGNSPCGPIGAFDVACAPYAIATDTRLASGTSLELRSPLGIPPGRTLILEAGCRLSAAPGAGGPEEFPSLIEDEGALEVRGTALRPVVMEPAAGGAAILVRSLPDTRFAIDHLHVQGGQRGIALEGGTGRITSSRFIAQDSSAVQVDRGVDSLRIEDSDITGASGIGLLLTNAGSDASVSGTHVSNCSEAVRLSGGRPLLEENAFLENDVAIRILPGGGAALSCETGARIRGNEFIGNHHAVVIEPGAFRPDMGEGELGNNLFRGQIGAAVLHPDLSCGPVPAHGNRFAPGDKATAEDPPGSVDWSGWLVDGTWAPGDPRGNGPGRILAMPNPSGQSVHFQVEFDREPLRVTVRVFDLQGKAVRRLFEGRPSAPRFAFDWDGRDEEGRDVASGLYWVRATNDAGESSVLKIARRR
jgi:hypothetical protein